MNQSNQPDPMPNNQPASWDLVLADIDRMQFGEISPAVRFSVRADIKQRDCMGAAKYGVRLQAFNGRDSLQDAYEESMDLVVYLRNCVAEGSVSLKTYRQAIKMMVRIRRIIRERDGM